MRTGLLILLAAWLVFPAAAAAQAAPAAQATSAVPAAQASASSDLILAIDARRTTAQGTSSAGDHGTTSFESYTYSPTADLCGLGTGDAEPARTPWVGWYFRAEVLGSSAGAAGPELNVRIRWERRWENGARTTAGPVGTNTVTMRGGDVLVLDRVAAGTSTQCGSELRLEASVMSASARSRGMRGTSVGRGGFAGAGGGRGGVVGGAAGAGMGRGGRGGVTGTVASGGAGGVTGGVASGGARGTGTTSVASGGIGRRGGGSGGGGTATAGAGTGAAARGASGTGSTTVSGRGGRGGGAMAGAAPTATTGTASGQTRGGGRGSAASVGQRQAYQQMSDVLRGPQQTAEVWLIHRTPDGVEHVQQQTIQFSRATREFSFPPVAVNTSRGVVMVDINGSLRTADTGISIGLSRRARASGASPLDTTGSSEMAFERPKPEDVLSFEFPALQKPAEDLLAKHRFSVRVRIR